MEAPENADVIIVGAGPAGLASAACLSKHSISSIILEKEDVAASLWKRRAYDRLKLHLAREFCELPHMAFPKTAPTFVPKDGFVKYLDDYVDHFGLRPRYSTLVESASYEGMSGQWRVTARSIDGGNGDGVVREYVARFLVVATGENGQGLIPDLPGLMSFGGEAVHSSQYKSGASYAGKRVLVVGSGNSGMEIAYDLANHGAKTTIAIRSQMHVMAKEMIRLGMTLVKYLPVAEVDALLVMLAKAKYGDLSKYGIVRPDKGPLLLKATTGRSAVIDVGTVNMIKKGEITVVKGVSEFKGGHQVVFEDGESSSFDVVVFATGYKSTVNNWLKDGDSQFGEDGFPKEKFPNHWKGKNGLYCAGFARRGLDGISSDARDIADNIKMLHDL